MAQHDYDIGDGSGAAVRADLNAVLAAIVSNNSGPVEPTATFANMWWFDTDADVLYQRDEANSTWLQIASKVGTSWVPYRDGVLLGDAAVATLGSATGEVPTAELVGLLARVGTWVRQQLFAPVALVVDTSGGVDWDLDLAQVATLDLDANLTLATPENMRGGGFYTLFVTQGGGFTLNYSAAFDFGDEGSPALSSAAGKIDVLCFGCLDGSALLFLGISRGY